MNPSKIIEAGCDPVLRRVEKDFQEYLADSFPKGVPRGMEWELRRAFMLGLGSARRLYRRNRKVRVDRALWGHMVVYAATLRQKWRDQ